MMERPSRSQIDVNIHLQMASPLLSQTYQPMALQGSPMSAVTPTLPMPQRLNVAGPPEVLASIPSHMLQLNEAMVEHTVEYVDQLTKQKTEMKHSLPEVKSDPDQKSIRVREDNLSPLSKFADLAQFSRVSAFRRVSEQSSTEKLSSKSTSPSIPSTTTHVQNIFISPSPQTLISQAAMPFICSNPSIPQLGYYILVNPQQPSQVASSVQPQPSSLLNQTTGINQIYYMLPDGSSMPAASMTAAGQEDKAATNKTSQQQQQRNLKRCQSPTSLSTIPSPKRRKRSSSLPNIKQPFYCCKSSKEGCQTSQSLENHLPVRHQGEGSETERETDHHSGSDTETATSDNENVSKVAAHSTTISNQATEVHCELVTHQS